MIVYEEFGFEMGYQIVPDGLYHIKYFHFPDHTYIIVYLTAKNGCMFVPKNAYDLRCLNHRHCYIIEIKDKYVCNILYDTTTKIKMDLKIKDHK